MLIFVVGAVEYKWRGCFCIQIAGEKRIESILRLVFELMLVKVAKVQLLIESGLKNLSMLSCSEI